MYAGLLRGGMDQAEQLEAQARELETEAVQLETEKLLIAATAKLQQARTLRVNADHMRQQYSGNSHVITDPYQQNVRDPSTLELVLSQYSSQLGSLLLGA